MPSFLCCVHHQPITQAVREKTTERHPHAQCQQSTHRVTSANPLGLARYPQEDWEPLLKQTGFKLRTIKATRSVFRVLVADPI